MLRLKLSLLPLPDLLFEQRQAVFVGVDDVIGAARNGAEDLLHEATVRAADLDNR